MSVVAEGIFTFGRFRGRWFSEASFEYQEWARKKLPDPHTHDQFLRFKVWAQNEVVQFGVWGGRGVRFSELPADYCAWVLRCGEQSNCQFSRLQAWLRARSETDSAEAERRRLEQQEEKEWQYCLQYIRALSPPAGAECTNTPVSSADFGEPWSSLLPEGCGTLAWSA